MSNDKAVARARPITAGSISRAAAIYLIIVKIQNKVHVYLNNKYFFWNSERYTIDQIKDQWKKDREHNYVEEQKEKNNKGGGLIIL